MENEDRWEAEANRLDIQNRIRNLMWTVSQDYELDIEVDPEAWQKSKYIAFYDAVRHGGFARYFSVEEYESYITKRSMPDGNHLCSLHWEDCVLTALCIKSWKRSGAVWRPYGAEPCGIRWKRTA